MGLRNTTHSRRAWLMSLSFCQDGSILCPRAGGSQCSAPADLHVLPVLGSDVLQRSSRAGFQGLQIQQLLHGAVAARAVSQPPARRLHHHDALAVFRLRAVQVSWRVKSYKMLSHYIKYIFSLPVVSQLLGLLIPSIEGVALQHLQMKTPSVTLLDRCFPLPQWPGEDVWHYHGDHRTGSAVLHWKYIYICNQPWTHPPRCPPNGVSHLHTIADFFYGTQTVFTVLHWLYFWERDMSKLWISLSEMYLSLNCHINCCLLLIIC